MKTMALMFFGIHYRPHYIHWMGWDCNVDFERSVANYKAHIFGFFKDDYKIDTFISSYKSDKDKLLIETYSPSEYVLHDFDNSKNSVEQRNARFNELLRMVNSYGEYDLYLITRFDLEFLMTFDKLKILEGKLNISYRTKIAEDIRFADDNFYVLTRGTLSKLIDIANRIPINLWYHEMPQFNRDFEINYMIDGVFASHESPLYKFLR